MVVKKNPRKYYEKKSEKVHMVGLPNVTNTIWKVQENRSVFTTIEKDKKYFINPLYIFT